MVHGKYGGVLKQNGFKVSAEDSADVKIVFHLAKFFVVEDNMYNGEFELRVEAFDKSGKNIWIGTTKGSSSRFGRSLKPQNYNETFPMLCLMPFRHYLRNKVSYPP